MESEQRQAAKKQMMVLMQERYPWQEAASRAGIRISRSTAYRWFQQFHTQGEAGLHDGRHGHLFDPDFPPQLSSLRSRRSLLLTLLFLNAVGLLTGRHRAYG
jgi:hypothetical protein